MENEKKMGGSREERAMNELKQMLGGKYLVIMDCSALMRTAMPEFLENVRPILQESGTRIIVPVGVCKELLNIYKEVGNVGKGAHAREVLETIARNEGSIFKRMGSAEDGGTSNLLLSLFAQYRYQYPLLFLTQSRYLAVDLMNAGEADSIHTGYKPTVRRISSGGYLRFARIHKAVTGMWEVDEVENDPELVSGSVSGESTSTASSQSNSGSQSNSSTQSNAGSKDTTEEMPVLPKAPKEPEAEETSSESFTDEVLTVTHLPSEGSTVWVRKPGTCEYTGMMLGKALKSGGEGIIYDLGDGTVAKIYKANKLTSLRKKKVLWMTEQQLDFEGICFPRKPLVNQSGEFVGYTMPMATGRPLRSGFNLAREDGLFQGWSKHDLVQLCMNIAEKMEYLHSQGILMGDINPGNILVGESPMELSFVDTDSYQLNALEIPCPVGQEAYTAPEILGKEYSTFLRSTGNENYAIAVLLFQTLLPGKLPYAHGGGGSLIDNVKSGSFCYALDEDNGENVPAGKWRFMWDHLPYALKEAFVETFKQGGRYHEEEDRLNAADWWQLLNNYHDQLVAPDSLIQQDPMFDWIAPTRMKAAPGAKMCICAGCGQPFPFYPEEALDEEVPVYGPCCIDQVHEWRTCKICNKEFSVTNRDMQRQSAENSISMTICNACQTEIYNNYLIKMKPVSKAC